MGKKTSGNAFFNGNTGTLWVNGLPIINCYKAKIVKKNKYEDIPAPIGDGTVRVKTGHTIDVSFAYKKTGLENIADLTGDDISIIVAETNIAGTIIKRTKAEGITFDEETLADFEKGKVGEIEFAGQAETCEELQ